MFKSKLKQKKLQNIIKERISNDFTLKPQPNDMICSCGSVFPHYITNDSYDLNLQQMITEIFGDGLSLFCVSLKDQKIKDLQVQDWIQLENGSLSRRISYSITTRKHFIKTPIMIVENQKLTKYSRKCQFESYLMLPFVPKSQCYHRILLESIDSSTTALKSWFHYHFDKPGNNSNGYRKISEFLLEVHKALQFHVCQAVMKQTQKTCNTKTKKARPEPTNRIDSRKLKPTATSNVLEDIVNQTHTLPDNIPRPPHRRITKKIKVAKYSLKPGYKSALESTSYNPHYSSLCFTDSAATLLKSELPLNSPLILQENAAELAASQGTGSDSMSFEEKDEASTLVVHLPGMYPKLNFVCQCEFSYHCYVGVTGYCLLIYVAYLLGITFYLMRSLLDYK